MKAKAKKKAAPKKAKKSAPKKAAKKGGKKGRGGAGNPAFTRPWEPSEALAAVVGSSPISRPQVVSKMWVYIKKHGLQDKTNKRQINADETLKKIFGKPSVSMFEMNSLLGKHLKG